jgi:hypothetical protein
MVAASALLLPGAAATVVYGTPTVAYTWGAPTTITGPAGNVLETKNVGSTSTNTQDSFSPVVAKGSQYGGSTWQMALPTGTYDWTFDFNFVTAPSSFIGYMRGEANGSNSVFTTIPTGHVATNQWYQATTTVTVTGGPWNGDTEIGDVEYSSTPAVTNSVLFDNFSFVGTGGGSVYEANPISFAGDTAGQAAPSSQIGNDSFNSSEVLAVPEPAALGLMALGGMGILLVGKRRKTA